MTKKVIYRILIVGIIAVIGLTAYKVIKENKESELEVTQFVSSRDSSYNGVYTLTRLDENGNNTWDGLVLYVENDKIIEAVEVDYYTWDEVKKEFYSDNPKADSMTRDDLMTRVNLKSKDYVSDYYEETIVENSYSGVSYNDTGCRYTKYFVNYYDKEVNMDNNTEYKTMKNMQILAAYEENSKELWLSRLIKNPKSSYYENSQLIHYKDAKTLREQGVIVNDMIYALNQKYNANIPDN